MPLTHEETEHDRIQSIMRAILVENALFHWKDGLPKSIDAFSVLTLERYGLVTKMENVDVQPEMVEILTRSGHEQRLPHPAGPLLFVGNSFADCSVVDPTEMLTSHDSGVRLAAAQFFSELPGGVISKRSKRTLDEERQEVASSDPSRWIPAGKRIDERLRNDIYLVLAGFGQCYEVGFEKGAQEHLNRLLRPNSQLIASIELEIWDPVADGDAMERLITKAAHADTIELAMEDYYQNLGHLPFAARFGVASVITRLKKVHDGDMWQALWAWADKRTSPVPRFHATIAFLADPSSVPIGLESILWGEVAEIAQGDSSDTKDTRWSESWMIREKLAQHLGNHLSCLTPGMPSERVFGVAWWITERICELLPPSPGILRKIRETIINAEADRSSYLRNMIHPQVGRSNLRYLTHFTNRVWSTSIVCELAGAPWLSERSQPLRDDRKAIEEALLKTMAQTCPRPSESAPAVFGFDLPLDQFWREDDAEQSQASRDLFYEFLRVNRGLSAPDSFPKMIEALTHDDEGNHQRIAIELRRRAYTADNTDSELNRLFYESGNWKRILSCSNATVLSLLFEALVETAVQESGHWPSTVTHMFAYASEHSTDDEQRKLLFALTLFACLGTNTVGALNRLMHGRYRSDFIPVAEQWYEQLSSMLPNTTHWASGRIRSILSNLKVDEIPADEGD